MKDWNRGLIGLASEMPQVPDPEFNEALNFLRLLHVGEWESFNQLNWDLLPPSTVFSLAVNVLKPEALLQTPFQWDKPLVSPLDPNGPGVPPLVALLTANTLVSWVKSDNANASSRAEHLSRAFWEHPEAQKRFPASTPISLKGQTHALGDVALALNAPSAEMYLRRQWNTAQEASATWAAFFTLLIDTPRPSFTYNSASEVFTKADELFENLPLDLLDLNAQVLTLNGKSSPLIKLAFKSLVRMIDHKLDEQQLKRHSYNAPAMSIEVESFTEDVVVKMSAAVENNPVLWNDIVGASRLANTPTAVRTVLGMMFEHMSFDTRQGAVEVLLEKMKSEEDISWAKMLPFQQQAFVLSSEQMRDILQECCGPRMIAWACQTFAPVCDPGVQKAIATIDAMAQKPDAEKNIVALTAYIANLANSAGPKVRKM